MGTLFSGAKHLEVSITHPTLNNLGLIFLVCWFNTSQYYCPGSSSALTLCLQLCSMLALFISSLYKWWSDIWARSDAPSISSLNMSARSGWRMKTQMKYVTDLLSWNNVSDRQRYKGRGKVLLCICVTSNKPLCWGMDYCV